MMAKVAPKPALMRSSVPIRDSSPKEVKGLPNSPPTPSPPVMEKPHRTQTTPTRPMETKLIIIMFSAALARVMPP